LDNVEASSSEPGPGIGVIICGNIVEQQYLHYGFGLGPSGPIAQQPRRIGVRRPTRRLPITSRNFGPKGGAPGELFVF
jgi:hypothetical protein